MAEPTWLSDVAVRWTFDDDDVAVANRRARAAGALLDGRPGVVDVIVAARSITGIVEPGAGDLPPLDPDPEERRTGEHHTIDVIYDGPDLADVNGLPVEQVVALHAAGVYTVAFIGFAPGFPYLLGLPDPLRAPRHATPRQRVEAGSVGIAGDFTGIYPNAGPGGWRIIGRTDAVLFDHVDGARLRAGDTVRFVAR